MVDSLNSHIDLHRRSGIDPTLERDSEARRWFDRMAALVYAEVREDFRGLVGPPLNFAGSGCRQEGLLGEQHLGPFCSAPSSFWKPLAL